MKSASTYSESNWDLTGSIWKIDPAINDGYPFLTWQDEGGSPLPVELTSFSATAGEDGILLEWETATEINNYGFEVERYFDEADWENIVFVLGHGNSNSPKSYQFMDENPPIGLLEYRLKQIDTDGKFKFYYLSDKIENNITGIEKESLPTEYSLEKNYPNPFNPSTQIKFSIAKNEQVELVVYNLIGEVVATLINEELNAGQHNVDFNAGALSSGVYIYKLSTPSYNQTMKMLLLK